MEYEVVINDSKGHGISLFVVYNDILPDLIG